MNKKNNKLMLHLFFIISYAAKRAGLFLLCMVICATGYDVFRTLTYRPQYVSSMDAVLKASETTYSQLEEAETYAKTLQYILNGQVVKKAIMEKMETDELEMKCQVVTQSTGNIVTVRVTAPTKKQSYYSLKYIIEWYQSNAQQYHLNYQMDVLEEAVLSEQPLYENSHFRNFRLGALGCLIILLIITALIVYFRGTIKSGDDVEKMIDCRLFSKIPRERKKRGRRKKEALLITSLRTGFYYRESIKKLRNRFEISAEKHGYRSVMITSTVENEGKSTIAANLALSLSQNQHKVLLIDGDLRKPSLHKIFSARQEASINAFLKGQATWQSQIQHIGNQHLSIICARQDLEPDERALEKKLSVLIKEAKREYDYVIIDVSPSYGIDEPMIINTLVDASFLVVKQNEASVQMINDVIGRLVQAKNNLIGCIYNGSVFEISQGNGVYGYRYGYSRYSRKREVR